MFFHLLEQRNIGLYKEVMNGRLRCLYLLCWNMNTSMKDCITVYRVALNSIKSPVILHLHALFWMCFHRTRNTRESRFRAYMTYTRYFYYENCSFEVPCLELQQWLQRAHMFRRALQDRAPILERILLRQNSEQKNSEHFIWTFSGLYINRTFGCQKHIHVLSNFSEMYNNAVLLCDSTVCYS